MVVDVDVEIMDVQKPEKIRFYQILGHGMAITGLGAYNWKWYKYPFNLSKSICQLYTRSMCLYVAVCFTSAVIYFVRHYSKLTKTALGAVYSIVPIAFMVNVKVFSAQFDCYGEVLNDFMEKIHLSNYYEKNKNDYNREKVLQVDKFSQKMGIVFFIAMLTTWSTWTITPILYNMAHYDEIINGTDIFLNCVYTCLPFDYLHDFDKWLIANAVSVWLSFCSVILISVFEILNYIIIFHLIGHIQIMKKNLETRITPTMSDKVAKESLIDLIRHHAFITRTFQDVEAAFGLNVVGNYIQILFEGGILMYQFTLGEKESMLTYGLMILIYMGGLVVLSLALEQIRIEADDLPETLYCTPWEHMSVENQKIVLLILLKIQPPLQFVAAGGFRPGVLPALTIIKTTFSYYVMIKSSM